MKYNIRPLDQHRLWLYIFNIWYSKTMSSCRFCPTSHRIGKMVLGKERKDFLYCYQLWVNRNKNFGDGLVFALLPLCKGGSCMEETADWWVNIFTCVHDMTPYYLLLLNYKLLDKVKYIFRIPCRPFHQFHVLRHTLSYNRLNNSPFLHKSRSVIYQTYKCQTTETLRVW